MKELTVIDYAYFSFVFSIFTAAMLLPSIGINNAYVVNSTNISMQDYENSKLIVTLGFLFILLVSSVFIEKIYIYSILAGLLGASFDHVLSKYQASENFKVYNFLLPLRSILLLLIMIVVLHFFNEDFIDAYFKSISIIFFISIIIYLLYSKTRLRNKPLNSLKKLINVSKGFIVFEVSVLVLMRLEVWLLTFFVGVGYLNSQSVAYYWAAFSFIFLLPIISSSLTTILLPTLKKNNSLEGAKAKLILIFLSMIILYISIACIAIEFLFGEKYEETLIILPIMGVGVFFSFIANLERLSLVALGKEKKGNIVSYCQLAVSLLVNIALIPLLGLYGAVLAFVSVRLTSLLGFYFILKKEKNHFYT